MIDNLIHINVSEQLDFCTLLRSNAKFQKSAKQKFSRLTKFRLYDFPFLSYKRLKKIYFSPFQVVQVHAISKQLGPVCAAKPGLVSLVLRSKIKKIYFALERRCKNRRHLQVVPKHGSMGQNILVHLHRHGFSNVFYSTMLKQLRS